MPIEMSAPVPTLEPSVIRAGDTLAFTRDLDDYPASEWTLTYYLIGEDEEKRQFAATASGQSFSILVSAATTSAWTAGDYLMVGKVSKASTGEQYQVFEGRVEILPNPLKEANYDARTFAEKMLEQVETAMIDDGFRGNISYSVNGRSFTARTHQDLVYLRNYLKSEIYWERNKGRNRKVITRFAGA